MARQYEPNDPVLQDANRRLSAQHAIQIGGYEQEGDFTKGVKDMDHQQELMQEDSMVQDEEYLLDQIRKARQEYLESPKVAGKVNAVVAALLKMENEAYENEAIDILTKAHKDSGAYQFKMQIGDIRIRQMSRRFRQVRDEGDQAGAREQARRQLAFELEEFTERSANYPTDLALRFELGRRQFLSGMHDEAIASLQMAQRDPRRSLRAQALVGQAFMRKGWLTEAIQTFERALVAELTEERSKELRYFLGDALDKNGELQRAQEQFSLVAQIDYNYKDVRERIEAVRKKIQDQEEAGGEEGAAE
jgi:tetratricopeptide (TPR) repeat protein